MRLRVLQFICPSGFYGAEMWVLALARGLNPKKVSCSLAITRESENYNNELYKRYQSLGLSAYQIPMNGRFDIKGILKLRQLIREKSIDIIHTHGYKSDIMGLLAARLSGIKCVATPHGFENSPDRKLRLFIRLGCYALKYFDIVSPLSTDLRDMMIRLGVDKSRICLIRNGVDLEEIALTSEKCCSEITRQHGEKVIGYVGQLIYRKNVSALLKAFNLLYLENKNVQLIIVGDGSLKSKLEKEAATLDASKKIKFLGFRKDRLAILKQFDLFCMTSSLEGIPRCLMEAMALEVPVVAFRIPGVDELIEDGKTGLLVAYGDIGGLKEAWKRVLYDRELAITITKRAKEHVTEEFSSTRMAKEYLALYESMISSQT